MALPWLQNVTSLSLTLPGFSSVEDGGDYFCSAGNIIGATAPSQPGRVSVEGTWRPAVASANITCSQPCVTRSLAETQRRNAVGRRS